MNLLPNTLKTAVRSGSVQCIAIIFLLVSTCIVACNHTNNQEVKKVETPKALEDKSSLSEVLVTKRMGNDLIEELYKEMSEKDSLLKAFNQSFSTIEESKNDSLYTFDNFNNKNNTYYNTAKNYIATIKDSVLKRQMLLLIEGSVAKYNKQILLHTKLVDSINEKSVELDDLYATLKIVKTLPLIEKYQKDNKPNAKALDGYLQVQNSAVKTAELLGKK